MAYPNGQVPFSVLIHLAANFWLPPGTAARWAWFVREGKRRFGVTFRITPDRDGLGGWNAYRPLAAQILYRKKYGQGAAVAGKSSHGGWYNNQEAFAIDVENWADVKWEDFVALANEAGFRTNFVTPIERWHVGDFNDPWTVPAGMEEDDMPTVGEIFNTPITKGPDGKDITLANFMGYSHLWNAKAVWNHPLKHSVNPGNVTAGDVLRYESAEHASTRAAGVVTDAQIKAIADAVVDSIGTPSVSIDYAKIGDVVRAKFAAEPLK